MRTVHVTVTDKSGVLLDSVDVVLGNKERYIHLDISENPENPKNLYSEGTLDCGPEEGYYTTASLAK